MDEKRENIEENNFKKLESNEIEDTEKLNDHSEDKKEQDSLFSEKKDDSPQDNQDIEAMQNKQLKWAVFLMASIILIIVIVPFVNTNFINKFDYHGLTFQKTQLGQIEFYSTKFPVVAATGKVTGEYAVNLRNDPREIEDIEVKVGFDSIDFRYYKNEDGGIGYYPVYISLDPLMEVCEDSSLALLTLSGFLKDSGLEVSSASMDKEYAAANDVLYKRCEEESTVILVTQGNENKITEIGETCYEIRFKDCDILKVSERFVLNILEQYGKRFQG